MTTLLVKRKKSILSFVNCGKILPSFELSIRDDDGNELEIICGRICLKGDSVMSGYFQNKDATDEVLDEEGWLDTGDIGFRLGDELVVTARCKDVIIVNGRNIWPHDLEFLAESIPGVRFGNVYPLSFADDIGTDNVVMVVESRENNPAKRKELVEQLQALILLHFGVKCLINLVPPRTLPRTSSSGKLSRSKAKQDFLARYQKSPTAVGSSE